MNLRLGISIVIATLLASCSGVNKNGYRPNQLKLKKRFPIEAIRI